MPIDTHAHLDDERFAGDLAQVVARAIEAGVERIVTVATTAESSRRTIAIANRFDAVSATVGIQPNHVAESAAADWAAICDLVGDCRVVAVGETGLDRHWDFTPFSHQEDYFARHLELARSRRLPVVIHCREAEGDVVRMLRDEFDRHGPVRGVMHSFTGDWETASACLEMGLFISFAGMVTYKNAANLREVANRVPADRLLVETDSPYLTPVPLRGKVKRNEPAHVVHTLRCLAEVRGVTYESLAAQTAKNAASLFGWTRDESRM